MFYPAAGVMLAFLLARRRERQSGFTSCIAATALMLTMSVLSAFLPQEGWLNIANFVIIIASVLGWIFLLTEEKDKARRLHGLCLHGKFLTAFAICAYFLVVKTGMVFLSVALQGGDAWAEYLAYWQSSAPWLMALVLVPNFFLSFLPFLARNTDGAII